MLHKMKLKERPFEQMKNGTKTIEFRLYDEKRKLIKIGDKIEFSKLPELKEKIRSMILNDEKLYFTYDIGHEIADYGLITKYD